MARQEGLIPCPCCGHLVFGEPPGSDDICPLCFWHDDVVQLRWPDFPGGANRVSLIEAQKNYQDSGASDPRAVTHIRAAHAGEEVDLRWRPFDPTRDRIERRTDGLDYGTTYANDTTTYYYWESEIR